MAFTSVHFLQIQSNPFKWIGSLQGRRQMTWRADDGALERRKATHLGHHCCLPIGWVVHLVTQLPMQAQRQKQQPASHTQSSQICRFREDAHLPAGCRRKLRHDERVSRAWAENLGDIRRRPWNLLSVPANVRFDTAFQRYPAARELCWWEPLEWLTIRVIISSINFCLPSRELLSRFQKNNNNNFNAFLSCYNASTPCFCTTLCQLTCRTYDRPTFWF